MQRKLIDFFCTIPIYGDFLPNGPIISFCKLLCTKDSRRRRYMHFSLQDICRLQKQFYIFALCLKYHFQNNLLAPTE
jgi:hypothetical protein